MQDEKQSIQRGEKKQIWSQSADILIGGSEK